MRYLITLLIALLSTSSFGYGEVNDRAISASIIELIASPEKLDKQVVRVIGVAQVEFEGNLICLTKEHLKYGDTKNCLWHNPSYEQMAVTPKILSKLNGKYVLLEGTFNSHNTGHMGLASGALENVTRYQLWEK
jgi:hypothetical protein